LSKTCTDANASGVEETESTNLPVIVAAFCANKCWVHKGFKNRTTHRSLRFMLGGIFIVNSKYTEAGFLWKTCRR
jgi:hypothetical protein